MAIPFAPTLITVKRPDPSQDYDEPYQGDAKVWNVVATGIRASIGTFSRTVSATEKAGTQTIQVLQLTCDIPLSGITHLDRVLDEKTGVEYEVHWVFKRLGLGLDHYTAELGRVEGLV